MMRKAWLGVTGVAALAGVVVIAACREPTAIVLEITTDVPCADVLSGGGIDVRIGAATTVESAPTTQIQTLQCDGRKVGSLTIVPSGDEQDQVGLFVAVASKANPSIAQGKSAECNSASPGNCIIAKRILRYVPHTTLALPIHLGQACAGSNCPAGESCDPNDGQCKPDDKCIKDPQSCVVTSDGGTGTVDAGQPCVLCNGNACVDFLTDKNNCGACGSRCNGACDNGACKLAANASPTTAEGCIGVDASIAMWAITGNFTGALAWAPGVGAATGTILVANGNFGNVAGSGGGNGFSTLLLPGTSTIAVDYAGNPPMSGTGAPLVAPAAHVAVGRSKGGTRCTTSVTATLLNAVSCTTFPQTILPAKAGPVAVGKDYWLVLTTPDTPGSQAVIGDFTGKVLGQTTLSNARAVSVIPGSNEFFVAHATNVARVGFDPNQGKVVTFQYFNGSTTVRGVRADSGAIFFAETPDGSPAQIRRVPFPPVNQPTQSATPVFSGNLTKLGSMVCLDSDATGVYFLSNGIPYRRPR